MGQLFYGYTTPKGVAGGLMDIAPYAINSRVNSEDEPGVLKFGMGAVVGTTPGVDVLVPDTDSTPSQFEGLVLTGFTNQMSMTGDVRIFPKQTVGLLRYGNAWARIDPDSTPAYGDQLYLITDGETAGLFTNDDGNGDNLAINGRFIGGPDAGDIAPVEIYNQSA